MPNKSVLFFPGANVTIGGGGAGVFTVQVATGALTADTPASIHHGLTYTNFAYIVSDATNNANVNEIYTDPGDTEHFIITVGIDMPGGLTVTVFGW